MSSPKEIELLSKEALFRLQLVSAAEARLERGDAAAVVYAELSDLALLDLTGRRRRVSPRTLQRWLKSFRDKSYAGLEPDARPRVEDSSCLSPAFLEFLKLEKKLDPKASLPEVIARARLKGVIGAEQRIDRTSVWRAARRLGLPLTRPGRLQETDMRSFGYPHRMQMGLVDGKHFRAGSGRLKRVLLTFLDDATRYGLDCLVGTEEDAELFLHALYLTLRRHGLMSAIYADRGGGFIADDSRQAVARLGIRLILGTSGYPEGHGKIEPTFRNLRG